MIDTALLIILIISAAVFTLVVYNFVSTTMANRRLLIKVLQSEVNNHILTVQLDEMIRDSAEKTIEQTDGFLKFISESRDWAFSYIEKAQGKVVAFGDTLEPLLHEDFLGKEDIDILATAYADLLDILPEPTK